MAETATPVPLDAATIWGSSAIRLPDDERPAAEVSIADPEQVERSGDAGS